VDALLSELAPRFRAEQLLISVCAGITLQRLGQPLLKGARIVRAMPNTPALVGAGATAFATGSNANNADRAFAQALFECVGECVEVEERLLDAVTGLSGSGPAYVLLMIEALADGAVQAGLPRATAQQLALQTVFGTACLAKQSGEHPALLKDRVTSPGGTTIAGLHALETAGFRAALMDAVGAAARRSEELGKATK
jgi:pyrroline-5-carboxylate reductase